MVKVIHKLQSVNFNKGDKNKNKKIKFLLLLELGFII